MDIESLKISGRYIKWWEKRLFICEILDLFSIVWFAIKQLFNFFSGVRASKVSPRINIVGRSNICDSLGKSSLQETNLESEIDNDLSGTRPLHSTFYDK